MRCPTLSVCECGPLRQGCVHTGSCVAIRKLAVPANESSLTQLLALQRVERRHEADALARNLFSRARRGHASQHAGWQVWNRIAAILTKRTRQGKRTFTLGHFAHGRQAHKSFENKNTRPSTFNGRMKTQRGGGRMTAQQGSHRATSTLPQKPKANESRDMNAA